ncbi:MAG: hypothetical protein PHT77_04155 [Bacteroidales bacterium]|jgi:hypothetical protein|nr:hypothetical protein [Bacteroidales bacterium]MDD3961039.1 hypothetical protein [Bacteroidales bacterium]HPE86681.1 hypothetical protein [Bacteroidales bacterium]
MILNVIGAMGYVLGIFALIDKRFIRWENLQGNIGLNHIGFGDGIIPEMGIILLRSMQNIPGVGLVK